MSGLKYKILGLVENDLEKIEVTLKENLNPNLDIVSKIASHILFSGGKRLRPLIMVLSSRICDYKGDYNHTCSVIFEYLHAATLLHDDLVDEARLRRGQPVANLVWDNPTAVLKTVAQITEYMSQGEIYQLSRKGALDLSEKEYMEIIRCKTAVLFQGACRVGALIANATGRKEEALSDYGFNLGIAFQMVDDLLDYTMDTRSLGKDVGADLKEGKLTLPVIYSLKAADEKDRLQMKKIIANKDFSQKDFKKLIHMMQKYGGQKYTEKQAQMYVRNAKEALCVFNDSETKETLLMLADYALVRKA